MFTTIGELLQWGKGELKVLGSDESLFNAERLLETVCGLDRSSLYLNLNQIIQDEKIEQYQSWIKQRKARKPLSYIVGKHEFWNETLDVSESCLIPRAETEILVEAFIQHSGFEKSDAFLFLDLGAGSGAIGIALLREFPKAKAIFSDISERALKVVRMNLEHYGLLGRAQLVQSDLFNFWNGQSGLWDAVVSNPPYLSGQDMNEMQPELAFEPREALQGGDDGYYFYRQIAEKSPIFLKKSGVLFLELGLGQLEKVQGFLEATKVFNQSRVFKDYLNIDRVIKVKRK